MKLSFEFLSRRCGLSLHNYDRVMIQFKWDESSCEIDDVTSNNYVRLSSKSDLGTY